VTSGLRRPVQAQARGGMVRVPLLVERALLQGVPALVKALLVQGSTAARCARPGASRRQRRLALHGACRRLGCYPVERSALQPRHGARAPATRRCSHFPGLLCTSAQVTPGSSPRARPCSHAPGARPQAEQAAYQSAAGAGAWRQLVGPRARRYAASLAAWAEDMSTTGSTAETLAITYLLIYEPEAAPAGTRWPARKRPAPPRARRTAGMRRRAVPRASRSWTCTPPRQRAKPCAGGHVGG